MSTDPELGAKIEGLEGFHFRIPRRESFRGSPMLLVKERDAILHWCRENGIELARLDMANVLVGDFKAEREWDVFVLGNEAAQAVQMRLRWS